jgi:hypothetical protein
MFVGKAGAYPRVEHLVGSGLTRKHWTRLERLARDKRSSLLRKFVTYGRKNFYNIGPRVEINISMMAWLIEKPELIYGFLLTHCEQNVGRPNGFRAKDVKESSSAVLFRFCVFVLKRPSLFQSRNKDIRGCIFSHVRPFYE